MKKWKLGVACAVTALSACASGQELTPDRLWSAMTGHAGSGSAFQSSQSSLGEEGKVALPSDGPFDVTVGYTKGQVFIGSGTPTNVSQFTFHHGDAYTFCLSSMVKDISEPVDASEGFKSYSALFIASVIDPERVANRQDLSALQAKGSEIIDRVFLHPQNKDSEGRAFYREGSRIWEGVYSGNGAFAALCAVPIAS